MAQTTYNKDLNVLGTIDLNKNEMLQMVLEVLATAPSSPAEGQMYYNSATETAYIRQDGSWLDLGQQGISDGDYGDVTVGGTGTTITIDALAVTTGKIANDAVTYAKLQNIAANNVFLGNDNGTNSGVQELTAAQALAILGVDAGANNYVHPNHTGDVTSTGDGATVIGNDKVTYAKIQNVAANNVLLGNDNGAGSGVQELSKSAVLTLLNVEDGADVTDATNVNAAGAVMNSDTSTSAMNFVVDEDTMSSNSATKIPTQQSVKAYVDNAITGGMNYKGAYNASTNSPTLDSGSPSVTLGDTYTVSVAGNFFTEAVEVGDVIISEVTGSGAANIANWTILQKNLDGAVIGPASAVNNRVAMFDGTSGKLIKDSGVTLSGSNTGDEPNASTTVAGIVEEATQTEVNNGTATGSTGARLFVNPSKLGLSNTLANAVRYTQAIGDGSATSIAVTHSIGRQFVSAQIFYTSTPYEQVECEVEMTSTTVTTFVFNVAPTTNEYTVVIVG